MLYEWTPLLSHLASVAAAALAVQLMDDAVDQARDQALGAVNWSRALGAAAAPYALLLLSLGALLNLEITSSLFLASYALGMAADAGERLPSGLLSWQESLLAVALPLLVWGWQTALWALALVFALQMTDDLLDAPLDRRAGELRRLLAGTDSLQKGVLAGLGLAAAAYLNPLLTAAGWIFGAALCWYRRPKGIERSCTGGRGDGS